MLKQRVLTALLLLAGFFLALFLLPQPLWLGLIALICGVAAWEWAALNHFNASLKLGFSCVSAGLCLLLGLLGGLGSVAAAPSPWLAFFYVLGVVFWIVIVPMWMGRGWRISSPAVGMASGLLVLIPPSLALVQLRQADPWILLAAMSLIWFADIAAYFTGRAFGRHKLAPAISPGKTWEGAAGATVAVVVAGLLFIVLVSDRVSGTVLALAVPLLVALTAISIVGDLFESLLKRQSGVKDSGTILPGHGGVLDRIDSLTSTLPFFVLAAFWLGY